MILQCFLVYSLCFKSCCYCLKQNHSNTVFWWKYLCLKPNCRACSLKNQFDFECLSVVKFVFKFRTIALCQGLCSGSTRCFETACFVLQFSLPGEACFYTLHYLFVATSIRMNPEPITLFPLPRVTLFLLVFGPLSIYDFIISLPRSSDNVILYSKAPCSSNELAIIWTQSPAFRHNLWKICSG